MVPHELPATWFAVTSLSFDISVLELLYTLTRGFTVVVYLDRDRGPTTTDRGERADVERHAATPMDFSLFYFSGDEAEGSGPDKYRLLLEGARWADEHGFWAVWTPERHFHAFGGLYPHPAVTGAAVAAVTENVGIRAGSVVMPLHHPIRVAEAWSVVDNLSNGRVAISFASGWQPNDFVLMPRELRQRQAGDVRRHRGRQAAVARRDGHLRRPARGDAGEVTHPAAAGAARAAGVGHHRRQPRDVHPGRTHRRQRPHPPARPVGRAAGAEDRRLPPGPGRGRLRPRRRRS